MTQGEQVYEFLKGNFKENEPILLAEIMIPGMNDVTIRQQLKKLTTKGLIKRFDTGIYYIPRESIFKSGSTLSVDDVIRIKYLNDQNGCCGYLGGLLFANKIGITTQVPMTYEVFTNKATTKYRNTTIGNVRVILKKPYTIITKENVLELQFLDLIKEVDEVSEIDGPRLQNQLISYMKAKGMNFNSLKPYLKYYPDKIYKNMYEAGLLNGISA